MIISREHRAHDSSVASVARLPNYLSQGTDEIVEESEDEELTKLGSAEFRLVGIRYYKGVAHPGEFVKLCREHDNIYDRNAIRIDNLRGQKVGHIKKESAAKLAPLMDREDCLHLEGSIPRTGNAYSLPLNVDFFSVYTSPSVADYNVIDHAIDVCMKINASFSYDRSFRFSSKFGGGFALPSNTFGQQVQLKGSELPPEQEIKNMSWQTQAQNLDEMFEQQSNNQLKDLVPITVPVQFKNCVTLFPHQVDGIKWLVHQEKKMYENDAYQNPFFKAVREKNKMQWLCKITQCSQSNAPSPIRGSILADEMGLGKTIQAIGLILLSPPQGHVYPEGADDNENENEIKINSKEDDSAPEPEGNVRHEASAKPVPPEVIIKKQTTAVLKSILKSSGLKLSGKKCDLFARVLAGIKQGSVLGKDFPAFMSTTTPVGINVSSSTKKSKGVCSLIVCPVSVMSNWQQQISYFLKKNVLNLVLYHGPTRFNLLTPLHEGKIDVLVVSYHTLSAEFTHIFGGGQKGSGCEPVQKKRRISSIFDIDFHRIILDEAHTIRNEKTKYFKAVEKIAADRRLALTGTPFVNKSDDIFSLFSFLDIEPLCNKGMFRRAISQPMKDGDDIGLTRLRAAMSFIALRRSKAKAGIKLAEKVVQLRSITFPDDGHGKVYEAMFGTFRLVLQSLIDNVEENTVMKNYSSVFEKILRLRQACCSATLIPEKRRRIALDMWKDLQQRKVGEKLSKEEGLALLEKLKGAFTQEEDDENDLPECAVCLMEMEQQDCCILKTCNHVFCRLCIGSVLKISNRLCPLCRKPFAESDMIDKDNATIAATQCDQVMNTSDNNINTPPKVLALLDAIKEMDYDEKGVIFSQFTSFLDIIEKALRDTGHKCVRIDGSMSPQKRSESVTAFSSDKVDSPKFIICSLHAAGTGINLTRGNWAFMMDCWWNESVESQAMDRIHRIGQTRNVKVVRYVMKDTIEERMVDLQNAKSLQAKGTVEKLNAEEKRKARLDQLKGLLLLSEENK